MARIRTIKPEFFTSEDITKMTPLARLFYVALWCESDREGRLEWKPGTFKLRYLPAETCDVSELAKELIERGLIVLYSANGKNYADIPTFTEHQVINNRESNSTIPERVIDACARVKVARARVKAEGKEGREGKEGKGKEYALTRFDEFWEMWPNNERKQDKGKCADKWKSQGCKEIADLILADIATKKLTQKWQGGFIESPEVYLNNKRWEDGVTPNQTGITISTVWHESAAGVAQKAAELHLNPQGDTESHPAFKNRVQAAIGRPALGLTITQLAAMAAQRQAA
ncbi:MAG: hypothetical protein JJD98_02700 [Polaromonas sp.]|nr:hypothetical protein [Polaromonas sp.]